MTVSVCQPGDNVQAWLNSGPVLEIESGSYVTGPIVVPDTVRYIRARGPVTLYPATGSFTSSSFGNEWSSTTTYSVGQSVFFVATAETIALGLAPTGLLYRAIAGSTNKPPSSNPSQWAVIPFVDFFQFQALGDAYIEGMTWSVDPVAYPQVRVLNFAGCRDVTTERLEIRDAGGIGIYAGNCVNVTHHNSYVEHFAWHGICSEGSLQTDVAIMTPTVKTFGIGIGHGIVFNGGSNCQAIGAYVEGPRTFGLCLSRVAHGTLNGIVKSSRREAFNASGTGYFTIQGVADFDGSQDFGCSIDGTSSACFSGSVDVNIAHSGASGVCLTGTVLDCSVKANIRDCNMLNLPNNGGVLLSGTNCQFNTVTPSIITDSRASHTHRFGVAEIDMGNGMPSNNTIYGTGIRGSAGPNVISSATTRVI